jgi:hypothetical protein
MQIRFLPEADTDLAEARVWYGLQRRPVGPKDRKIPIKYSALSGLGTFFILLPGATRSASLRTCPWLSYLAPLALRFISL